MGERKKIQSFCGRYQWKLPSENSDASRIYARAASSLLLSTTCARGCSDPGWIAGQLQSTLVWPWPLAWLGLYYNCILLSHSPSPFLYVNEMPWSCLELRRSNGRSIVGSVFTSVGWLVRRLFPITGSHKNASFMSRNTPTASPSLPFALTIIGKSSVLRVRLSK